MDLQLGADGDLALERGDGVRVAGAAEIVQRLRLALGTHTGEWLLNTGFGTDWRGAVLGKGLPAARAEAELKRAILATPGVARLTAWRASRAGRELHITFELLTDDGDALGGTLGGADSGSLGAELLLTLLPGRWRPGGA